MTSIASESVATILCTSKQTRFDIKTADYRELDIEGLNITVTASENKTTGDKKVSSVRAKSKAKGAGLEILTDAKLRLKAGQRYALVGRNGSGKSTLLKAIAEKLIPGIPEETRISILQQTDAQDTNTDMLPPRGQLGLGCWIAGQDCSRGGHRAGYRSLRRGTGPENSHGRGRQYE